MIGFSHIKLFFRAVKEVLLLFIFPKALQNRKIELVGEPFLMERYIEKGLPLIISFAGLGDRFEFQNSLKGYKVNILFFRDLYHQWYLNEINHVGYGVNNISCFITNKINEYEPTQVITIGSSAGGYAALLYGSLLKADRIIAFSPQTFRNKFLCLRYFDYRWLDRVSEIYDGNSQNRPYLDLKPLLKNYQGNIFLFFDTGNRLDRVHSTRISGATIEHHSYDFGGHTLVTKLKELGKLDGILRDKLNLPV